MGKRISAAILTGGSASRMKGVSKSGLFVAGETVINRILRTIDDLFSEIIIVSNARRDLPDIRNCIIVSDIIHGRGPAGGIHAALQNTDSQAVFVFAGDMPLLDRSIILQQISLCNSVNYDILVPRYGNNIEPLHSVYSSHLAGKLGEFISDGKNNAIRDFFNEVNTVYMDLPDNYETRIAFSNINNPEDLVEIDRIIKTERQ